MQYIRYGDSQNLPGGYPKRFHWESLCSWLCEPTNSAGTRCAKLYECQLVVETDELSSEHPLKTVRWAYELYGTAPAFSLLCLRKG
jgi:hypothetical protein